MNELLLTHDMHVAFLQSEMDNALSLRRHHRKHRQRVHRLKIERQSQARVAQ